MQIIPFFANTADDLHCLQACLRSVLKHTFPTQNYSFRYLDSVTAHKPGKGTWNYAMFLFLGRLGFDVVHIGAFDDQRFARDGVRYLRWYWTDEVYQHQARFSDFAQEQRLAKKMVQQKNIHTYGRPATVRDMERYFERGYILIGKVNARVLDRRVGFSSHAVVITNLTASSVTFHDPGNPPQESRRVRLATFLRAMQYPNAASADLTAVRYKKS